MILEFSESVAWSREQLAALASGLIFERNRTAEHSEERPAVRMFNQNTR
jgi:hypothetical protein